MDLAEMIYTHAKKSSIIEECKEVLVFSISIHVHIPEEERCEDDVFSFRMRPSKTNKNQLQVEYKNAIFTHNKNSDKLDHLIKIIMRQMIRDHMNKRDLDAIAEECIVFTVKYRGDVVFEDEIIIGDPIDRNELSHVFIESCNGNDELYDVQRVFLDYVDMFRNFKFSLNSQ